MRNYLIVCEGPHDCATIGKVLKTLNFSQIKAISEISECWKKILPTKYPFNEDNLDRVSPVPDFYVSSDNSISVAIKSTGGDSKLIEELDLILISLERKELKQIKGVSIFLDADDKDADTRIENLYKFIDKDSDITFKSDAFKNKVGDINGVDMKANIFIFPNNHEMGTLEDLLIEIGQKEYPDLIKKAINFVDSIPKEYESKLLKGSKKKKSIIGIVSNILKPGKANQITISDDKWITLEKRESCQSLSKLYDNIIEFIDFNKGNI